MADVQPESIQRTGNEEKNAADQFSLTKENKLHSHNVTGLAVVEQGHTIPTTGDRKITTKWEYWSYCLYGKS